jgi:phosphatidylserine/phosphatidylglycerophosphate/cardiolipin synthase-like enzyme
VSFLRPSKRTHEGNEFTPIVDGESAYRELLGAIRAAKRFIYLATWSFDPGLELTRSGSGDPVLRDLLLERAKDGLEVKVLVWDFLSTGHSLGTLGDLFRVDLKDFKRELAAAGAAVKKGSSLFFTSNPTKLSGRVLATGSDHQKFWVVDDAGKDPMGFVGGLNLGQHEWDTPEHKPGDRRRTASGINRQGLELQDALQDPLKRLFVRGSVEQALEDRYELSKWLDGLGLGAADKKVLKDRVVDFAIEQLKKQKPLPPRHDVTGRIRGPAAGEVLEEFRTRWTISGSGALGEKAGTIKSPSGAKTRLQVAHTAYYKKPGGPQDIWKAYLHALKQAERYVYIENQYFTSRSIRNVLIERLRRRRDLHIVILLPLRPEEFFIGAAITLRQSDTIKEIRAAAKRVTPREERVHVFGLSAWNGTTNEYEQVYIHAKVAIVDDEWMTIGSANTFARSFEYDTELNSFCNDVQAVVGLRRRLWSEHLGIDEADDLLKRPMKAIEKMAAKAEANGKKKSGALDGRVVPMTFDLPPIWLHPMYNAIANQFL